MFLERTSTLSAQDLLDIPDFLRGPTWSKYMIASELQTLRKYRVSGGIHLSPYMRYRFLGHPAKPTRDQLRQMIIDDILSDPNPSSNGIPTPTYSHMPAERSAWFGLMYEWDRDSDVDWWPVYEQPGYEGYPQPEMWQDRGWFEFGDNTDTVWVLSPRGMFGHWRWVIENYSAYELSVTTHIFLDNCEFPWGGGGSWEPCIFGDEYETSFIDAVQNLSRYCHSRGMKLVTNGCNKIPDELLPYIDEFLLEYGFDDTNMAITASRAQGKPIHQLEQALDTLTDFQRAAYYGAIISPSFPGEVRDPDLWAAVYT